MFLIISRLSHVAYFSLPTIDVHVTNDTYSSVYFHECIWGEPGNEATKSVAMKSVANGPNRLSSSFFFQPGYHSNG